jgi:hypothetical protein
MVDLSGSFWNQLREQLTAWYIEFSDRDSLQLLVNARLS